MDLIQLSLTNPINFQPWTRSGRLAPCNGDSGSMVMTRNQRAQLVKFELAGRHEGHQRISGGETEREIQEVMKPHVKRATKNKISPKKKKTAPSIALQPTLKYGGYAKLLETFKRHVDGFLIGAYYDPIKYAMALQASFANISTETLPSIVSIYKSGL